MSGKDRTSGMKSAYELALERLAAQGIEGPQTQGLSQSAKQAIADARRVTESRLAELEILHRAELSKLGDPAARAEQEARYRRDRERAEADGERAVARLRAADTQEEQP